MNQDEYTNLDIDSTIEFEDSFSDEDITNESQDRPRKKKTAKRPVEKSGTSNGSRNGVHKRKKTSSKHAPKNGVKPTPKNGAKHKTKGSIKSGTKDGVKGSRRRKKKKEKYIKYIQLAIILLIFIIGIVVFVKLKNWSKGKDSGYDPTDLNTGFDTETEDYFVPLDSKTEALQKQDGITTVLLLGNGSIAKEKGRPDSVANQLEQKIGGKVYDASLDHTYLSVKNVVYDESDLEDSFSLFWIAQCIGLQDFTLLNNASAAWEGDDTVRETTDMLRSLDYSAIDAIVIMYDYHDFREKRMLMSPYDSELAGTCCGCLLQSIQLLRKACPQARIIVGSPFFSFVENDAGEIVSCDGLDFGEGTLADYMVAYKNIAVNENASFIDNYLGTITPDNYEDFLDDDYTHLNANGRTALADRMSIFLK